jgi:hypothetical protein
MPMNAIVYLWLAAAGAGVVGVLAVLLRPPPDRDAMRAVRWSAVALAPSALPLAEYGLRRIGNVWVLSHYVAGAFMLASLVGAIFVIGSFLDWPFSRRSPAWQFARLAHVCAWATGAIVSVAMVLG